MSKENNESYQGLSSTVAGVLGGGTAAFAGALMTPKSGILTKGLVYGGAGFLGFQVASHFAKAGEEQFDRMKGDLAQANERAGILEQQLSYTQRYGEQATMRDGGAADYVKERAQPDHGAHHKR